MRRGTGPKLLVFDRRDALVPLTTGADGLRSTAALVHRLPLSEALAELFEASRQRATPMFEELGTCHRKGESAVGVSTDSATPAIWLMSKPSMSTRNSGLDRYASSRS